MSASSSPSCGAALDVLSTLTTYTGCWGSLPCTGRPVSGHTRRTGARGAVPDVVAGVLVGGEDEDGGDGSGEDESCPLHDATSAAQPNSTASRERAERADR